MNKSFVAFRQLLVSDQKLTKAVEPGVRRFDDPTSVLERTPAFTLLWCNPWGITPDTNLLAGRLAVISLIRVQKSLSVRKGDNDGIKHRSELACVMSIGPCYDQRQRDATPVHQYVALGSFFSPGPSDSARLLPAQGEL